MALSQSQILLRQPTKTKERIASKLGQFLAELQSIDPKQLEKQELIDNKNLNSYDEIDETVNEFIDKVFPYLMRPARQWIWPSCHR